MSCVHLSSILANDSTCIVGMTDQPIDMRTQTFELKGPIAGLIYSAIQDNVRPMAPEILSGHWDLKVVNGKVSFFSADFEQIAISASFRHQVAITNFVSDKKAENQNIESAPNITLPGTVDITFDLKVMRDVSIEALINKLKVLELNVYIDRF